MEIGKLSLKNGGGFVAKLHVIVREPAPGEVYGAEKIYKDETDIPLGQEHTVDLSAMNIPPESIVKLKAFVVWGTDNVAHQAFKFKPGGKRVRYSITGTTLSNELGLVETVD